MEAVNRKALLITFSAMAALSVLVSCCVLVPYFGLIIIGLLAAALIGGMLYLMVCDILRWREEDKPKNLRTDNVTPFRRHA